MKKYIATLMLSFCSIFAATAMSYEEAREQALYLTDKMAYELNLNEEQYNYCYEINLDYLMNIQTADDVNGPWLTYRNADIRNILYDWQYSLFIAAEYFFRPVYWLRGAWYYPIYNHYAPAHFFFDRPRVFFDYRGGHSRLYFRNSFYVNRPHWNGGFRGMERGRIEHRPTGSVHVGRNGVGRTQFGGGHNRGMGDARTRGIEGGRPGVSGRGTSRPDVENRMGNSNNRTGVSESHRFGAANNGHVGTTGRTRSEAHTGSNSRAGVDDAYRFGNHSSRTSVSRNYDRPSSTRNVTSGINHSVSPVSGGSRSVSRGSSSAFGGGSSRSSVGSSATRGSFGGSVSRSSTPSASRGGGFSGGSSRGGGFSGGSSRGGGFSGGSSRGGGFSGGGSRGGGSHGGGSRGGGRGGR